MVAGKIRRPISGGVAHLGERLNGIQEVESSILFVSTNRKVARTSCFCRFFILLKNRIFTDISNELLMTFHYPVFPWQRIFETAFAVSFFLSISI